MLASGKKKAPRLCWGAQTRRFGGVDGMRDAPSEGASELIAALGGGASYVDETVNVPNRGAIANLPESTIVEVPAVVSPAGILPVQVGPLPEPVGELSGPFWPAILTIW